MRLINVTTYELQEFYDTQIPDYAIVSHRWRDGEVSFQQYERLLSDPARRKQLVESCSRSLQEINTSSSSWYIESAGLRKIISACIQTKKDHISHVWIDTCAIDKTSSTELQEAINSMYRWYEQSRVCYAFLDDVQAELFSGIPEDELQRSLRDSEWFARGWTLQEFLAPSTVDFFGCGWNYVGSKSALVVPQRYFQNNEPEKAPIGAEKRSLQSRVWCPTSRRLPRTASK
jgi:hypothetical protein